MNHREILSKRLFFTKKTQNKPVTMLSKEEMSIDDSPNKERYFVILEMKNKERSIFGFFVLKYFTWNGKNLRFVYFTFESNNLSKSNTIEKESNVWLYKSDESIREDSEVKELNEEIKNFVEDCGWEK